MAKSKPHRTSPSKKPQNMPPLAASCQTLPQPDVALWTQLELAKTELGAEALGIYLSAWDDTSYELLVNPGNLTLPQQGHRVPAAKHHTTLQNMQKSKGLILATEKSAALKAQLGCPDPASELALLPIMDGRTSIGWISVQCRAGACPKLPELRQRLSAVLQALAPRLEARRISLAALRFTTSLLDAAADGIGLGCPITGRALYLNASARAILRIAPQVETSEIDMLAFRPSVLHHERDNILKVVGEKGSWSGGTILSGMTGSAIPVFQRVQRLPFPASPSGWAIAAIIRDLRNTSESERLLGRSEAALAGLCQAPAEAYFVWDHQAHGFSIGGQEATALLGYTPEEAAALPEGLASLVHPLDRPRLSQLGQRLAKASAGTALTDQWRGLRKDGKTEVFDITQRICERGPNGELRTSVVAVRVITPYVAPVNELRRSEEMYRQIVDDASDSVFVFDTTGLITYANRHAEKLLGYRPRGFIGKTIWQVFILPHKSEIPNDFSTIGQHPLHPVPCEQKHKNGKRTIASELQVRRLDATHILGIASDLSQKSLLLEATTQQDAYYKGLFQNNTSGAAVFDEKLRLTAVNHALLKMLNCLQKDLLGHHIIDIIAPESLEEGRELFGRMRGGDRTFNETVRSGAKLALRCRDGKVIQSHAALTMIGDETVLFKQGIAIFTDITTEIRYRRERDKQAKFNEDLLAETAALIIVLDRDGHIMRVNAATEALTGYPAKKLLGRTLWEVGIIDPEQAPHIRALFAEVLNGRPHVGTAIRIFTRQGGIKNIEIQSTAIRDEQDNVQHIITTGTDITERTRLEAEVIRVAEQEQMRIGHDLHDGVGQVLTGALSLCEALEVQLKGQDRADAGRVRQLLREGIDQVRQLSRGLSPAAIKNRSLAQALTLMADRIRSNKLCVECKFSCDPEFQDPGIETHLYRIAQEAVSNAVRHAQPRQITLILTPDNPGFCRLEVQNDGIGFNQQKALKAEGIGVRVMQYRANLIGGQLLIKKGQTGGTTLSIRFPCILPTRRVELT
jgi:PAS domain S-box-containing protein